MSLQSEIVRIARREIGVSEIAGSNCGPRVNQYKAATWLDPKKGWAWCAAFVCWVLREAMQGENLPWKRPQTAGAWDFENWAIKQPFVELLRNPKPSDIKAGDIVIFRFSHIGIAVSDGGSKIKTVEGNTDQAGSREGGSVLEKSRDIHLIRSRIRLGVITQTTTDFVPLADWCFLHKKDMAKIRVPSRYYDAEKETTFASLAELEKLL